MIYSEAHLVTALELTDKFTMIIEIKGRRQGKHLEAQLKRHNELDKVRVYDENLNFIGWE